ncbi:MAG TPA: alkaline phosphatase family protein [Beutenbergiaceae bacterium]|nr:alkaline phosphatase family protein [Beutenbergiaceae bacterium]
MTHPAPLTKEWRPAPSTPWLGEVLLGAVGAVHGELPAIALRAPGGMRRSARTVAPGVSDLDPTEQLAAVNPSTTAAVNRLGLPEAERAVVILVDGLGQCNLQARGERAPFLTSEFLSQTGQSAYPSTTAANISFLGTGVKPGQTAMAGYTVRNPDTGKVMNLISWAGGMDPLEWQRVPTVFERMQRAGARSAHVSTWRFERSALTQAALRGAEYIAAETLAERVDATAELLQHTDTKVAYLYWAEIDAVGHLHGWQTPEWDRELEHLDGEIARLVSLLPPGTLVLLTADHGMVDVPQGASNTFGGPARIDVNAHAELSRGLDLVAGENRFLHLFTREPDEVARRWEDFLGERARIYSRAEAFNAGLFGPVRPDVADVVGDVIVALLGDLSIADRSRVSEGMFALPGLHGSVTEWERAVPILSLLTS